MPWSRNSSSGTSTSWDTPLGQKFEERNRKQSPIDHGKIVIDKTHERHQMQNILRTVEVRQRDRNNLHSFRF